VCVPSAQSADIALAVQGFRPCLAGTGHVRSHRRFTRRRTARAPAAPPDADPRSAAARHPAPAHPRTRRPTADMAMAPAGSGTLVPLAPTGRGSIGADGAIGTLLTPSRGDVRMRTRARTRAHRARRTWVRTRARTRALRAGMTWVRTRARTRVYCARTRWVRTRARTPIARGGGGGAYRGTHRRPSRGDDMVRVRARTRPSRTDVRVHTRARTRAHRAGGCGCVAGRAPARIARVDAGAYWGAHPCAPCEDEGGAYWGAHSGASREDGG